MPSRILIAGTHSGVGKTTIATAIMAAYRRAGYRVQGFKAGPDFIDPTFHRQATGRPSHNLDTWMLSPEANIEIFNRAMQDADVAVVEGVMGLFDGKAGGGFAGSTAELALWLDAAVVLVVDAASMSGSVAAIVNGFDRLHPDLRLAGVICNRVSSERHYGMLRDAIAEHCTPALLGRIPVSEAFTLPSRHLGLHLAEEVLPEERVAELAAIAEEHLDLDAMLAVSKREAAPLAAAEAAPIRARIGVARDAAFSFYYEENLAALRRNGAELVEFSPLADASLPQVDGLFLGGGYPELHAQRLSENQALRAEIAAFASAGNPVYAECGGFMYLTEAIVDTEGEVWPMAGVFPVLARMQTKMARLGYIEVQGSAAHPWLMPEESARGHQFRYSLIDPMPLDRVDGAYAEPAEGYKINNTLGSYVHLHFASQPNFAARFVDDCVRAQTRSGTT